MRDDDDDERTGNSVSLYVDFHFFHVHDLRALNDVKKIRMMMMPMMKSTFK